MNMTKPGPTIVLALGLCPAMLACTETDGGEGAESSGELATRFMVSVENLAPMHPYLASGVFDTPEGASEPGPLLPGASYSFEFHAPPGTSLSFATMFVPSNDLFFAPAGEGIALFDDEGMPRSGDLSGEIHIWDAGTEHNEALGLGAEQAPTQSGPNTGAEDPDPSVRLAASAYPELPAVSELIAVSLVAGEGNSFRVTIENLSDDQSLTLEDATTSAVPLAPGVFVLHGEANPLFTAGEAQRAEGLEALAEDGNPGELGAAVAAQSGVVSPLAPGVWAVLPAGEGLFVAGEPDAGLGLESLAEDGDPAQLQVSYADANIGVFGGIYGDEVAPLPPGEAFFFEFEALPGERLSFVSMFVQSNDIFLGTGPVGVELFDAAGEPLTMDISAQLSLWDLGTELNEAPGAGPNQAPRQAGPNTGPDEDGVVAEVDDGFVYPASVELVRVIVTPE